MDTVIVKVQLKVTNTQRMTKHNTIMFEQTLFVCVAIRFFFGGKKLGQIFGPLGNFLAKITIFRNFQSVFLGMNFSMLKCNLVYRAVIFDFWFWHLYFFVHFHDFFARFFYVVNLPGGNFGLVFFQRPGEAAFPFEPFTLSLISHHFKTPKTYHHAQVSSRNR